TGLFLVSFLFVHMSGNLLLFKADAGLAFNQYTKFMTTNPVIKTLEWVLFAGFIFHIIYAAILSRQNTKARPVKYAYSGNQNASSSWFSRNMGWTGTIILLFLVIHLIMFWGYYKFGDGETVALERAYLESWKVTEVTAVQDDFGEVAVGQGDYLTRETYQLLKGAGVNELKGMSMYEVTKFSFGKWYISLFYVVAMVLLGMHLNHGFQSAFRTIGLVHKKYTPLIKIAGMFISIVVPIIFASMPVYLFLLN
ncbi:MAG: succinate dehydrogenase cytochrome b subunit, partial [Bacteroidota bacterium]